jgi:tetratricopeptide (TPR) repeat protein
MLPGLLAKLDAEAARAAKSDEHSKAVLDARAALSGKLVEWARGNQQESIRKAMYRYMVYDADAHYQSATAQPDARKRGDQLRQTLSLYDKLLDANGLALWRDGADPAKVDIAYGDVHVLFSKALVLFELGDYQEAAKRLGRLLEDRKLGTPRIVTEVKGELTSESNPEYWEATYKLYRSNFELAEASTAFDRSRLLEETRNGLKRLYIRDGAQTGGAKWHEQFEKLRQELIPDFTPDLALPQP